MTSSPIAERETTKFALNQPSMIKVRISDGAILQDNRDEFFEVAIRQGDKQLGQRKSRPKQT